MFGILHQRALNWKAIEYWAKYPETFWGDFNDIRFTLIPMMLMLKNDVILDIGCGIGIHEKFVPMNNNLVGIDIDEYSLSISAKENPWFGFIKAHGMRLPFKDESFKHVIISAVIEFIPIKKRVEFLREVYRVMKNTSSVLILTPNRDYPIWTKHANKVREKDFHIMLEKVFETVKYVSVNREKEKVNYWLLAEATKKKK